ncbi:MAG: hypothetical protein ABUL62_32105 [Myxococcales bacterium]
MRATRRTEQRTAFAINGKPCKQPSPPKKLYHYTKEAGFHGILQQRELRLTHFKGTIDNDEIRVADPLFLDVLNRRLADSQAPHVLAMLADRQPRPTRTTIETGYANRVSVTDFKVFQSATPDQP